MSSKTCRRAVAALAIAASLFLSIPSAQAAALGWDAERSASRSWLAAAWGSLANLWDEHGTSVDPNGAPAPGETEHGTSVDPDGAPAPESETGPRRV